MASGADAAAEAAAALALAALPRRADRYVSDCGLAWEAALLAGVSVNGASVQADFLVFPAQDVFRVGCVILPPPQPRTRVFAFYKPARMATDMKKLPNAKDGGLAQAAAAFGAQGVFPVGQLDVMTTGLLLFTGDGDLAFLINSPGTLQKVYSVGLDGLRGKAVLAQSDVAALTKPGPLTVNKAERDAGRRLNEASSPLLVSFDAVECVGGGLNVGDATLPKGCVAKARYRVDVTLSSGANHVIKRLFAQRCQLAVRSLHRIRIGPVSLKGLSVAGDWRELSQMEVSELWASLGGLKALLDLKRTHLALRLRADASADPRLEAFLADPAAGRTDTATCVDLLGGDCGAAMEFGAHQAIIVRTSADAETLPPQLRDAAPGLGSGET
ncbi:hypothetical protein M885DRAFT_248598 [Pelagophyceae sp. CCMP2097]|nr:hypothetical protein M885DRAFT_248598 [Pelagophyceae sp. CCMP2097]